uniref:Uncharacterized protein n=1 Tax=Pseudomonas phage Nican01 TaxID=3138540 RepID=A0AAU6W197_9CAUD
MIWLFRLYNLPVLIGLHYLHSVEFVKVQRSQHVLFAACEDGLEQEAIDIYTSVLELHLERLADLDERMKKLWQRH